MNLKYILLSTREYSYTPLTSVFICLVAYILCWISSLVYRKGWKYTSIIVFIILFSQLLFH